MKTSFGPEEGWFEKGVISVVESVLARAVDTAICKAVDSWVNTSLGQGLANVSRMLRPWMEPVYPIEPSPLPPRTQTVLLDLRQAPIAKFLQFFATDFVGDDGPLSINKLLAFFLPQHALSRNTINGANISLDLPGPHGNITVTIGVAEYNITGVDSFSKLLLLNATAPDRLQSLIALDQLGLTAQAFLEVVQPKHETLVQWSEFQFGLADVSFEQQTSLAINRSAMSQLHGAQPLALGCDLRAVDLWNTTFLRLNSTITTSSFTLSGGNMDRDVDQLITHLLSLVLSSLQAVVPGVLRGLLNGPGREKVNANRVDAIANATCPAAAKSAANLPPNTIWVAVSVSVVVFLVSMFGLRRYGSKEQSDYSYNYFDSAYVTIGKSEGYNPVSKSTLLSQDVPMALRTILLVLLIGACAIFTVGLMAKGGPVYLQLEVNDKPVVTLPPLYYLSLYGSMSDAWNAKVYSLSIFLAITNLIGPVLRVVVMGVTLITTRITHAKKRAIITVCDLIGKWTFAQSYVAVLMMTAFRYSISLGDIIKGDRVVGSAHIFMIFDWWGWWGIITCTAIGLLASHMAMLTLTLTEKTDRHFFEKFHPQTPVYPVSRWCRLGVPVLILSTIIGITVGIQMPAFTFQYRGMTALLEEGTGTSTDRVFSILSTITALPDPDRIGHMSAARFLQISFFTTSIVAPLLQAFATLWLWSVPMSLPIRRRVTAIVQVLSAWSALDVLLISIVIGFLQISLFSQFIVGHKCDVLAPILHLPQVDALTHGDDKCLDVHATLHESLGITAASTVALHIVSFYVLARARSLNDSDDNNDCMRKCPLHSPPQENGDEYANTVLLPEKSDSHGVHSTQIN